MKILVLVKQVPMIDRMEFDPESKTLKREGVPSEVSAFDLRALVKAVELRGDGDEVVAMTMGPPQARDALVQAMALGADRSLHLTDRAFAGADTLATARALAAALRREGFDLVLCGRVSTDAETGQVGPEIAELLDVPQVTCARTLEIDRAAGTIRAERETDDGFETVECPLPALVTAAEDLAPEKFAKRKDREAAKEKPVVELTAADLGDDPKGFGAAGSPTTVEGLETIAVEREGRRVATVDELAAALREKGYGKKAEETATETARTATDPERPIWVVVERSPDGIRRVSLELLGKARELSDDVTALVIGPPTGGMTETLARHGARKILVADDPALATLATEPHAAVLAAAIESGRPSAVLVPSTVYGRDVTPRVAARLGLGLTGDAIDLSIDEKGRLLQWKPAFGGNVVAPIVSRTTPDLVTVRPGLFAPRETGGEAEVENLGAIDVPESRVRIVETRTAEGLERAAALDTSEVAIGVGKGVGEDGLARILELADRMGAAVATTRDVTDEGWLPKQHQVGLTGRAIAPRFYFAIGISGAFEHLVGLRKAGTIIAINTNEKAPIFDQADLGLVGDWKEILPSLAAAL